MSIAAGHLVGEGGSRVGGGVHGDGHPPQRREVAEGREPGAPVGDPPVSVAGVGQPGGNRHHPQRGGQVAGVPVADQPVPAAEAILGRQQLGGRQGARQLEHSGVLQDHISPVAGVTSGETVLPAQPLHRQLGERQAADPDHASRSGQRSRRSDVEQGLE